MMNKPQVVKPGRPASRGFNRGVEIAEQREQVGVLSPEKVLFNLAGLAESGLGHALYIYLTQGVARHPQSESILLDWAKTTKKENPEAWKFCQNAMEEYGT
jgi:hypothetical protein